MTRAFTYSYAILADVTLLALLVFGEIGLLFTGHWWLTTLIIATGCFVIYANLLLLSGRYFTIWEVLLAIAIGAGLPLLAIIVAVLLVVLIGVDIFS